MKTKKWLVIMAAAALAAGGIFVVRAHEAERAAGRFNRGAIVQHVVERLGLSDAQVKQIKAELSSERENLKSLFLRLHDTRKNLREAIRAADATEASVRTASAKVSAVEADLAVERLKLHGRISPILTGEQREKLGELEARVDDFVDRVINQIDQRLAE